MTRRKIAVAFFILIVVAIGYPVVHVLLSLNAARPRRLATLNELREYEAVLRLNQWDIDPSVTIQFQNAISELDRSFLPDLHVPQLVSAYVLPANMPKYPNHPRSITIWWLEDGFTVDGIALYVDGKHHSSIDGWGRDMLETPGKINERFGKRYDRYLTADVIVDATDDRIRDYTFVLSHDDLGRSLEIELLTSDPPGDRIPLLVARQLSAQERDEP